MHFHEWKYLNLDLEICPSIVRGSNHWFLKWARQLSLKTMLQKTCLLLSSLLDLKKTETTSKFLFLLKSLQNNMTSINSLLCLTDNTKNFPHSDKALDFHEACYLIKCSSCYVRFNHCQAYIIETFKGYFSMPCDTPDGTYIRPQA